MLGYFLFYIKRSEEKIFGDWIISYESGNDVAARKFASKMDAFNSQESAFYLAHMAVSDSINLNGQARTARLSDALKKLENSALSIPGSNQRPVIMLKASINALLGNVKRATSYAIEACKLNKPMPVEECLNGPLSFDDPEGSRWMALQYYEQTNLYNVVGKGNKTRSRFYEAVAMKYFNIEKANFLRDELVHENVFTDKMQEIYCNPVSPVDAVICKVK